MADGDHHVFLGNQIFRFQIPRIRYDGSAAGIPEPFLFVQQIIPYDAHDLVFIAEYIFQVGNGGHDLFVFVLDFLAFQSGQALQAHIQDGLGLPVAETEFVHQRLLGHVAVGTGPNGGNDFVQVIQGDFQALQNVGPFFWLSSVHTGISGSLHPFWCSR